MGTKKTKKLTMAGMFTAIGVALGNLIYIPIGASKCFPVQHVINVLSATILGPIYSVGIAFSISLLRNILGTGSLLAFPGSMIGALIAGLFYKYTKNKYISAVGEVFGTGVLGGFLAFPLAKYIMGKEVAVLFFVYPFILSSIGGSVLSLVILNIVEKNRKIQVNTK
ncbi:energy coupling factor transporter S component ThiW [Anaerosalibacter massiliensis]|uniref:Energy coupling factor transporter S component ThiW n=1 Tax=Anaerosalibacter massiliensis TaxID=1347392 RepID=A0A9X2MHK0_9FIRM|nr:energy coupling factor transporter S component ThiW [Anaerosalibacter massiliensis]MCR2044163.1 energy coupling factor transporter S component ThiW [Anaerosalibacter massiliensis]